MSELYRRNDILQEVERMHPGDTVTKRKLAEVLDNTEPAEDDSDLTIAYMMGVNHEREKAQKKCRDCAVRLTHPHDKHFKGKMFESEEGKT